VLLFVKEILMTDTELSSHWRPAPKSLFKNL
jgi:hypothetical protein